MANEAIGLAPADGRFSQVRMLFGGYWLFNLFVRLQDLNLANFMATLKAQATGEPRWMQHYILAVYAGIDAIGRLPVGFFMGALAAALAVSLLTGRSLRLWAWIGIVYTLFLWSTVDAFGGPYGNGSTDPATLITYTIVFVAVLASLRAEAEPGAHGDRFRLVRILFGLLWAFDAFWKWQPYFLTHAVQITAQAAQGTSPWVAELVHLAVLMGSAIGPVAFGVGVALVETGIAVSLLSGRGLRIVIPLAVLYCLGVWATAEAFGGPYGFGSTGVRGGVLGNVVVYLPLFGYLWIAYCRGAVGVAAPVPADEAEAAA